MLPRHLEAMATSEDLAEIMAEYQLQAEEREHRNLMDEIKRVHGDDSGAGKGAAFGRSE